MFVTSKRWAASCFTSEVKDGATVGWGKERGEEAGRKGGGGARVINIICCEAWNKTPCRKIRRKGGRRGWQQLSQLQPDDSVAPEWHFIAAVTCLAVYWHTVNWSFILGDKNLEAFYCQVPGTGSSNLWSSVSSTFNLQILLYVLRPIIDGRWVLKWCKDRKKYQLVWMQENPGCSFI